MKVKRFTEEWIIQGAATEAGAKTQELPTMQHCVNHPL